MSKISYPAIFHEDNNSYWVDFPDLDGCLTSGVTLETAFKNAKEALSLYLDQDGDIYRRDINKPSSIEEIRLLNPEAIVILITITK